MISKVGKIENCSIIGETENWSICLVWYFTHHFFFLDDKFIHYLMKFNNDEDRTHLYNVEI